LDLKQKAISGVKWTTLSTIITTILQLLQLAILTRFLDPSAFGLMALVMVVIGFSQTFLDMGISNAIIHKQKITKDQLSTLYWVNVLAGFLLFLIIIVIAPFIAEFYKEPELTELVFIVALTFIIQPFGQQFMVLWQKKMRFGEIAKIDIVNKFISLVVSVYLAYKGYGVYALVYGTLAGIISQTMQFMYLGLKEYRPSFIFKLGEIKEFLSFGAYQMGEKGINYISANIDKILIGRFMGMEALGFYNLAWQLIIFPLVKINPIVNKVAFPLYAKVQHEPIKLSNYYTMSLSALFLIIVPLLVFMFFYSHEIVYIAYGNNWSMTADLLSILVIVGLLKATGNPSGALILAIGRADVGFYLNLAWAIVVGVVLYVTMMFSNDIMSVVYALLALSLSTSYLYHYIIQKVSKVAYKQLVINFFKVLSITLIIGYFSYIIVYLIDIKSDVISVLIGSMIYFIIYGMYIKKYEVSTINIFRKKGI
jgi:O-antigen/teichoic acid export membrane protein